MIEALDRALRQGAVDPQLLDELGWTRPQAEDFVAEFKRRREASLRGPVQTELAGEVRVLAAPTGGTPGVRRGTAGSRVTEQRMQDARHPDRVNELLEPGRQRIAPRYRALLEAYYRGLASQPAAQ